MKTALIIAAVFISLESLACPWLEPQSDEVKALVQADARAQWLVWEQQSNLALYRKSITLQTAPVTYARESEVNIVKTADVNPALESFFGLKKNWFNLFGNMITWPKHPDNTNPKVPFFHRSSTSSVELYYTASRTMVFADRTLKDYSIKMPTDHTNGADGFVSKTKAVLDVTNAIRYSNHIREMDKILKPDPSFRILLEVLAISEKETGNGILVRDIRALNDGNYHLPGFSIPFVGREIAKINGAEFVPFWTEHYFKPVGAFKAKMLLRYGLQMRTPNNQNFLAPFYRTLAPTGIIEVRDIGDSRLIRGISENLGFQDLVNLELSEGSELDEKLNTHFNDATRFLIDRIELERDGAYPISEETFKIWEQAHEEAYFTHLIEELNLASTARELQINTIGKLDDFLKSPQGTQALETYAAQARAQK